MTQEVTYRWLDYESPDEDWIRVDDIMAMRGWMALNKMTALVLVAEQGEELVGFHVLQLIPHVEPLFVRPSSRGSNIAETLADKMQEYLTDVHVRGYMAVAEHPVVEKICENRGMRRVESPVYTWKDGDR